MPFSGPTEDRLAIRELMDIYADAVNQRDTALWASTWAEDSAWKLPVIPGMENLSGKDTILGSWHGHVPVYLYVYFRGRHSSQWRDRHREILYLRGRYHFGG